ncbi:MAG TPA: CaiB/BaiF CoA-transferase family protein, partial [Woeseiaceae bacterium]|nr:CaiB/BaiF CoA-transferase family protein [Woeseiaceae bacterium]
MGPLAGVRVVEIKGIGPGPYAGMLLADMGADVIVVERATASASIGLPASRDIHGRGKRSIALDLKHPQGLAALLRLVGRAELLLEGFRPGVAERLGFGPDDCLSRNPALVYGRVTGWGQHGPLAGVAGHDINYISITGVLAAIGAAERPAPPLNLVGDYAGGSLFVVIGMLAALLEARASGSGQVVDAAITDGSASLMSVVHGLAALGHWQASRRANLLDGGAPNYDVYETRDGRFVSVGALEPAFFALLRERIGLADAGRAAEPAPADTKARLAALFRTRTQREWCELLAGSDACVAPVLDYTEAPQHPHNRARHTYIDVAGVTQPAPAPRFSRSVSD